MPLLCISLLCPNSRVSKLSELVASGLKPIWIKRGCRIRWVHRYGRKSQSNPFAHFHCLRCQTHHIVPSLSLNHQQLHPISEDDPARFWSGPLPGDLSEVEAFCRLFRLSEQLHNAVMDALNSLNRSRREETTVSENKDGVFIDNSQFSDGEDIPLLEQKVVAGLGCIGALLRQHKQEVLAGRVSCSTALDGMDDSRPPLASFRAEMKRCCKQLGPALYCYFPPVDQQSILIHRRFQKLMNACFDVGYPRPEGAPSHDDIPNWAAVQLWTGKGGRNSETEEEVLFWRGGQLTEDGLSWLLDKGFKLIVDLRAEDSMNQLAEAAVADAICSSRLRLVRLPVEPGTAPTKEQVKAFAELVAAPENHPLYLQSCEGAGRTSAMVSRWRELTIHKTLQTESNFSSKTGNGSTIKCKKQESSKTKVEIGSDIQKTESHLEKNVHKKLEADASSMSDIFSSEVSSSTKQNDKNCLSEIEREDLYTNMHGHSNILNGQESRGEKVQKRLIVGRVNPFEAQRPKDILSKQAMSEFRKGRRVVPSEFTSGIGERETHASVAFPTEKERIYDTGVIAGPAGRWGLAGPGIPRAGADGLKMEPSSEVHCQEQDNHNLSNQILKTPDKVAKNAEGSVTELFNSQYNENNSIPGSSSPVLKLVTEDSPDDDGDELSVSGDMCASTTGVVRIQSRKKAEMYLVRTDGFSCTRERVKESTLAFTHPSTQQQMLMWKTAPRTVLLLIKLGNELMAEAQQVASFLHYEEGINVVVEPEVHDYFARFPGFGFIQTFYSQDTSYLHERVDFVVCLGGDGLVLHASNLFRNAVPPIVAFNLGSLGFLTAHAFEDFSQDLRAIIHGNNRVEGVYITLRMRLRCELFRDGKPIPGKVFDVLNEVVVDRGSSPYLCKIECYERNRLITKVQADGVIVATPTGSTAYSTAAGGSMVHPNVPCILFTPICPHSLSFRPVILPDSALLELKIPGDARSNAWVSFDGKRRQQLCKGDSIRVGMSKHPLPTVNKSDQTDDWFCSLVRCLNWNERFEQKSLKY